MIGQFFNCVTPSASGGQPVQAYYMIKSGLPGSKSTSALISKFMVYQCTLIVYTGILFVLKFSFFKQQVDSFVYLAMVGFAVNLIVMGFLICISVFQAPTKKVIRFVLFLGEKLHIVKHRDILLGKVDSQIADYSIAFRENCKDIKNLLFTVGLSAVQLTLYFLVSVCIYLGFGLPDPGAEHAGRPVLCPDGLLLRSAARCVRRFGGDIRCVFRHLLHRGHLKRRHAAVAFCYLLLDAAGRFPVYHARGRHRQKIRACRSLGQSRLKTNKKKPGRWPGFFIH